MQAIIPHQDVAQLRRCCVELRRFAVQLRHGVRVLNTFVAWRFLTADGFARFLGLDGMTE